MTVALDWSAPPALHFDVFAVTLSMVWSFQDGTAAGLLYLLARQAINHGNIAIGDGANGISAAIYLSTANRVRPCRVFGVCGRRGQLLPWRRASSPFRPD